MASTNGRMFIKGVIWELTGFLALWIITGSVKTGILYTAIRILMYFAHEKLWKYIKWGKYSRNNKKF